MKTIKKYFLFFLAITSVSSLTAGETETTAKRQQSYTVGKNPKLEVSISGGDITIKTWDKNVIDVAVDGLDDEDLEFVKITNSENFVRVSYRPKWNNHGSGEFTITVPTQCEVDLKTSGGNIELAGNLTGNARGSTSGGDIRIEKIKGTVDMKTSGGNVKVGDVDGKADLSTSGGDIRLGNVNGEAEVNTSGGDIRITSVGKRVDARTSGGNIDVGDVGGDARLSTAGGDVRVGKVSGSAVLKTAGGDLELLGASGTVEAKTAGGDVVLKNITGSVKASTAGGNVSAELNPTGKGSSELKTAGGDVKLFINENAKATIEATIRLQDGWGVTWGNKRKNKQYTIKSDFTAEYYDDKNDEEIRAKYILNGGGETIDLQTSNGNIVIRKK